jgi:hypothetical protein
MGQTQRRVFSLRTKARYMDATIRYAHWAKAEHGIVRVERALRPELVRAWMYQRLADGVSAATLKQEVCGIGKAARIAGRGSSADWTALVRELPRRMPPPSRAYGPDGDRLVGQVAARSPEAGLALRFIQETGARIGSVVRTGEPGEHRLLVDQLHVHDQAGVVHLEGKGGRTRDVRVSADLYTRLQDLARGKAPDEPVFDITAGHLRYELQVAGRVLGVPTRGRSVHGFRYDYALRRAQELAADPDALEQAVLDLPGRARADYERLRAAWRDEDAIDRVVSEELCHSRVAITHYYQR